MVFLAITTELTATLLLAPNGTQTLATAFWSHSSEIDYAGAAPYALLMVLMSPPTDLDALPPISTHGWTMTTLELARCAQIVWKCGGPQGHTAERAAWQPHRHRGAFGLRQDQPLAHHCRL